MIPSGILYPQTKCYIGAGTVVDPKSLLKEIELLEKEGIDCKTRLFISPYAHVIFPYHQRLDSLREEKAKRPIGTTERGITPCYEDGVARRGIRVGEWIDPELFKNGLQEKVAEKNALFSLYEEPPIDFETLYEEYEAYAKRLKEFVFPFEEELDLAIRKGEKVLFEGAQGAMLDIHFGTYPFVTSSSTTSGGLVVGAGLGPSCISKTIGVMKAYSTRVGNGPFPTELSAEEESHFTPHSEAREFGTSTGRKRRIGWLDIPLLQRAIRLSGVNSIALTKMDILDTLDFIKICVKYDFPPIFYGERKGIKPVYETLPGWKKSTKNTKKVEEFPKNVRIFVNRLETLLECPIEMVSFGPEREKTLILDAQSRSN